jgi:hypothetical protein
MPPSGQAELQSNGDLLKNMEGLKVQLTETREQLAYVYGALEEIAQRQEVQASWQIDVARRLLLRPVSFAAPMAEHRSHAGQGGFDPHQPGDAVETNAEAPVGAPLEQPGDSEMSEAFDEILASADMLFKKLTSRNKGERVRGLKAMERILKRHKRKDKEPMFIILPAKMDLH